MAGFLHEIPLVLMLAGVFLAIALPRLSATWGRVLVIVTAVLAVRSFYYLLLTPGWQPAGNTPRHRASAIAVFAALTLCVIAAAVAYFVWGPAS
jgi:hypothetical protein